MPRAAACFKVFLALSAWFASAARADQVTICYNYGCHAKAHVEFGEAQLAALHEPLAAAADAAAERQAISAVIGRMYAIAGEQTPIWRDKGGNFSDRGEDGQMDCVDHSANTYTFLSLLEMHGWLKFHEVLEPLRRVRFLFAVHWAARIREKHSQETYVVDSWYYDNGHPAIVIPVEDWRSGKIPHDA
jgi:extradiol dioxygenase family protein